MAWALRVFPNSYIWGDPEKKADNPARAYNYLRMSTHVLGQILRLSQATQAIARQNS